MLSNQIDLGDTSTEFGKNMKVVFYLIIACIVIVIAVGVWEAAT